MAYIEVEVDVDVSEHLDELHDNELLDELESRGYKVAQLKKRQNPKKRVNQNEAFHTLDEIAELLGVKKWQGTERMKENLSELIEICGGH